MKISNFKLQLSNSQKGYSLVELLVVIFILVVIGGIVTSILVSSLRGSNKSTAVNEIRQNGNSIISQMAKMIEYAKSYDGVSTGEEVDSSGNPIFTTNCTPPPAPTPAPPVKQYKYLRVTGFDGGHTTFACSGTNIASNSAVNSYLPILSSKDLVDAGSVNVVSCYFLCIQPNALAAPTIDINFTLSKKTTSSFTENKVQIPFETSVVPRNFNY